ncbi:MAG TPA: hypothetical protein VEX86_17015 [Longimicrobium sp.]|nr:hypothetical protein [Longimicrobium sp.]
MVEMMNKVEQGEAAADRAFVAFLAALYLEGLEQMSAGGDLLHKSFHGALHVLRQNATTGGWFRRFRASPTSGRIEALDRAIIRAEQYGLVQFPNPSYTRVRVALSPVDAQLLLSDVGEERETIEQAAREFRKVYEANRW